MLQNEQPTCPTVDSYLLKSKLTHFLRLIEIKTKKANIIFIENIHPYTVKDTKKNMY